MDGRTPSSPCAFRVIVCALTLMVSATVTAGDEDRCRDILIDGVHDTYQSDSRQVFFSEFRRWLDMSEEEIRQEVKSGKVDAGLGDKVIKFKVAAEKSSGRLESLKRDLDAIDADKQITSNHVWVAQSIANEERIEAWRHCMDRKLTMMAETASRTVRHKVKEGEDSIDLTIWWDGDAELRRPKIRDFYVLGGEVVGKFVFKDNVVITPSELTQTIRRSPGAELCVVLNTDRRGSVVVRIGKGGGREELVKEKAALKSQLEVERKRREDDERVIADKANADAEEKERLRLAERITQVRLSDFTSNAPRGATDANFHISLSSGTGKGTAMMPDLPGNEHEGGKPTNYPWVDVVGDVQVATLSDVSLGHDNSGGHSGWLPTVIQISARTNQGRDEVLLVLWYNSIGEQALWWDTKNGGKIEHSLPFTKP